MSAEGLDHRHILLKARGLTNPLRDPADVETWLLRLVEAVGMKVFMGPYAKRCDTPGNEGTTGAVVIETSHASAHFWDRCADPHVQIDLFSCAPFTSRAVVELAKEFGPAFMDWIVVDRNGPAEVVEVGDWSAYP